MRLAAAVLADSANVREDLVNALSLGVNRVQTSDFPTAIRMSAVVIIEIDPSDGEELDLPIAISMYEGNDVPEMPQINGQLHVRVEDHPVNVPLALPLDGFMVHAPGVFTVRIAVGEIAPVEIRVLAESTI